MHNTAHAQLGQLGCAYAQPSEAWPAGIRSPVQVGNPQGRRAAGPVLCQAVPGAAAKPARPAAGASQAEQDTYLAGMAAYAAALTAANF